ncbi:hypothetical protein BJX61DRAFT_526253 [Aspergillus egyptiacus]|nr:hypothetical protein BJX61DRAFT_526253 [Aspergillus egyptiacus]
MSSTNKPQVAANAQLKRQFTFQRLFIQYPIYLDFSRTDGSLGILPGIHTTKISPHLGINMVDNMTTYTSTTSLEKNGQCMLGNELEPTLLTIYATPQREPSSSTVPNLSFTA